jgi:hexosaminidase
MPFALALLAAALFRSAPLAAAFNVPQQYSSVWPLPAMFGQGSTTVFLAPTFSISCGAVCPEPLPDAVARYTNLILFAGRPSLLATFLPELIVTVVASAPLALGVDESYNLTVPSDGSPATLHAATQWGALRGLESFSQLCVWQGPDGRAPVAYAITNAPVVIRDFPRFPARGVLIDTSFNYLTVEAIGELRGR